jgi:hypothetical protein
MEQAVDYLLRERGFAFESPKRVITILAALGAPLSRSTEDFGLYSEQENKPLYIQCKASGGGEAQHGKAVMNRAKEQIARSLLYRCKVDGETIVSGEKNYVWSIVLDGNWKLPIKYPLKYIHMLQIAGYDRIFKASDLVLNPDLQPRKDSPLIEYLESMKCKKVTIR